MVLNEEDRMPILIKKNYYQKGYGVRKVMNEFTAKTLMKTALNFLNRLNETGNRAEQLSGRSSYLTANGAK